MDEPDFDTTIRRFLKEFGVSAHQAVEAAIRAAVAEGRLRDGQSIAVSATLAVDAVSLSHTRDGTLHTKLD